MSDAGLILGTRNQKKLAELRRILEASGVDVSVTDLSAYPDMPEVAETGATFTENALLKARAVVAYTGRPAVAEDSGLCVDALNGMPGVLSARWAGRHGDDQANLRLVLAQLADVPADRRGATSPAWRRWCCRPGGSTSPRARSAAG
jgi:Xanthosine triphosphate pyrophosphatase